MTERKARQLAHAGAMLIVGLIFLSAILDFTYPEHSVYRKAFFCLFGLLFLYARAVPGRLWVPD